MFIKRVFDVIVSLIGLLILWPLILGVAVLIKLKMPGPIFFCQKRVGRYGIIFTIIKFRTMIINHGGNTISIKGESRITPLGSKLRKYKIDELPELINVLKGDMSFVGPRPDMPEYALLLKGKERKILELRPGITGPATLLYANEEELLAATDDPEKFNNEQLWPSKVKINMDYYYNRSFLLDMKIILKTVLKCFTTYQFK
jgi:lipopolysaccharide/colanic/teichoic acid biosynthesis glycosyltransferase